jgi:hypothetical protein
MEDKRLLKNQLVLDSRSPIEPLGASSTEVTEKGVGVTIFSTFARGPLTIHYSLSAIRNE